MRFIILFMVFVGCFVVTLHAQTVLDYDGNVYNVVTIGSQRWLGKDLKVTHYNNGDSIPNITNDLTWDALTTGAYCNYSNDTSYVSVYGRLYNYKAAVDSRKVCPLTTHLPSLAEWTTLTSYLGSGVAGGKLKESDTIHWHSPNTGATNETGFTALPAGQRNADLGYDAYWWTGDEYVSGSLAWIQTTSNLMNNVASGYALERSGYSIRCICDIGAQIHENGWNNNMKIFPNPSNESVTVNLENVSDMGWLIIMDAYGNRVYQRQAEKNMTIQVQEFANGIYLLQEISQKGNLYSQKLVIQH